MTILVTGGNGFIGSAVVRALLARGESLRLLLRPGSDRRNLEGLAFEVFEGDLRDSASLRAALQGCRALFHLAADYRLWAPDPEVLYATNVTGTETLMRAAIDAGIERVLYTSSVAALGLNADGVPPGDERTPVRLEGMIGHYKRSKFLAEDKVRRLIAEEGLAAVIVNPSAPVGPRDIKPTPTGRLILDAARGAMPAYVDTGLNLVHVDDVAAGHLLAFDKGAVGEGYILGGENLGLKQILALVAKAAGRRPPRIRLPIGPLMPVAALAEGWARLVGRQSAPFVTLDGLRMARKKMYFSHAKAAAELGYRPRPVTEAVTDSLEWFRRAGYLS